MNLPTIPVLNAGQLITADDMNNLASAVTFALNRPIARVHQATPQNITATTGTPMIYDTVDFDPDGMFTGGGGNRLTVQTPGFYKFRMMCNVGSNGCNAYMQVITGANNPLGSGHGMPEEWPAYTLGGGGGGTGGALGCSGLLNEYLYAGDFVQCNVLRPAGAFTTQQNDVASFLMLEWVSM